MTVSIDEYLDGYRIVEGSSTRSASDVEKAVIRNAISGYLRTLGIATEGPLGNGDAVRWISSGTRKRGHIVACVPAGRRPEDVGYPKAGGGGSSRDHDSFVIRGRRVDAKGNPVGSASLYWPHASLVERDGKSAQ